MLNDISLPSKVFSWDNTFQVTIPPSKSDDAPRLLPTCFNPNGKKSAPCEFDAISDVRFLFRTPSPRKQNGNILFYLVKLQSDNGVTFRKLFTDSAARKLAVEKLNLKTNKDYFCEMFDKNGEIAECPLVAVSTESNDVFENRTLSEELGTLNATCFIEKDVDFCGYRMIEPTVFNTSHNALANFFEDPGTYTITEFRLITSGIVKSLPKLTAKSNKDQFEQHLSILLEGNRNVFVQEIGQVITIGSKFPVATLVIVVLLMILPSGYFVHQRKIKKELKSRKMIETDNPDFYDFDNAKESYYNRG